jgi:ADP-ribosyl-[dinitrogen reductase] hydrolase
MTTRLGTAQLDGAAGVLLGMACGDVLVAGYEFGPSLPDDAPVRMKCGGSLGWASGGVDRRHLDGDCHGRARRDRCGPA